MYPLAHTWPYALQCDKKCPDKCEDECFTCDDKNPQKGCSVPKPGAPCDDGSGTCDDKGVCQRMCAYGATGMLRGCVPALCCTVRAHTRMCAHRASLLTRAFLAIVLVLLACLFTRSVHTHTHTHPRTHTEEPPHDLRLLLTLMLSHQEPPYDLHLLLSLMLSTRFPLLAFQTPPPPAAFTCTGGSLTCAAACNDAGCSGCQCACSPLPDQYTHTHTHTLTLTRTHTQTAFTCTGGSLTCAATCDDTSCPDCQYGCTAIPVEDNQCPAAGDKCCLCNSSPVIPSMSVTYMLPF